MEDRIARRRAERPGAALIGLVAILAITLAWWALALWPVGSVEPEWLARTRAACFGSSNGGLPGASGWILLIGEPIGMLAMLLLGWGRSLRHDLALVRASFGYRAAALGVVAAMFGVTTILGVHVARATEIARRTPDFLVDAAQRLDAAAPVMSLIDQRGRATSLADFHGRPVLVTFAYGHCTTVCPATVNELRVARRAAGRPDLPLIVITLDPWRDTPDRLPAMAEHWGLAGSDRVLSGPVADVERVLDAFGVARQRDQTTGDIAHISSVFVVDSASRLAWRLSAGAGKLPGMLRRILQ